MKKWFFLLLLPCCVVPFWVSSQTVPVAGGVGAQPSTYSRHLLTLPNMAQWQGELGINPNGTLVAGTNITLQIGNGKTVINSTGGTNTNALALFVSTNNYSQRATVLIQQAHGFTNVPSIVEGVLVCLTNDNNFLAGQEFNCSFAMAYNSGGALLGPAFNVVADTTNVYLIQNGGFQVEMVAFSTFAFSAITFTNWQVKVYARP